MLLRLGTDAARGLSTREASTRLAQYGRNELRSAPPVPTWRRFLAQLESPLVLLLLAATESAPTPLQRQLDTGALNSRDWLLCAAMASTIVLAREAGKAGWRAADRRPSGRATIGMP